MPPHAEANAAPSRQLHGMGRIGLRALVLVKRAGRRGVQKGTLCGVCRARATPLCTFRCVGSVPSAMGSLFEIHIATHASLQYAEHVRQVCKRAATERTA